MATESSAAVHRQLDGTYHSVSTKHLQRYVDHAAFLYNTRELNDGERIQALLDGTIGKRPMYREPVNKSA